MGEQSVLVSGEIGLWMFVVHTISLCIVRFCSAVLVNNFSFSIIHHFSDWIWHVFYMHSLSFFGMPFGKIRTSSKYVVFWPKGYIVWDQMVKSSSFFPAHSQIGTYYHKNQLLWLKRFLLRYAAVEEICRFSSQTFRRMFGQVRQRWPWISPSRWPAHLQVCPLPFVASVLTSRRILLWPPPVSACW